MIENRCCVVPGLAEQDRELDRQVLIELEPHALCLVRGMPQSVSATTRSFASSAA